MGKEWKQWLTLFLGAPKSLQMVTTALKLKDACSLYKKDLHDPDNHDGVITDLEPDILECEVKWALESITTNKASRGDRILVELFQILKDDAA